MIKVTLKSKGILAGPLSFPCYIILRKNSNYTINDDRSGIPYEFLHRISFDELNIASLLKSRISSFEKRYLPRFRIGLTYYRKLIQNKGF